MKKKLSGFSVWGYILFFATIAFNFTLSILIYTQIQDRSTGFIAIIMVCCIFISAALCTAVDIVRRKIMIERPVQRILEATDRISKGDFNVEIKPIHIFSKYDEYDMIIENINVMMRELKHNEVLKNDFISNVSHEIKTPLAVIQSYAQALKSDKLDLETKNKYLDVLISASRKLGDLVGNILKLNKLENQSIAPEAEKLNVAEVLRNCIISFEDIIEGKGLRLECELEDMEICSSKSYLEIIFNNLLSNAVKFTERGEIRISLKREETYAVIRISDSGCGISEEVGKHIFDKFYQGDTSHSKEGNGLGLALVKKVIDILGGEITIESIVNVGTAFTVRLGSL